MLTIKCKRLDDSAYLPVKAHATDAGFDLRLPGGHRITIPPGGTAIIDIGIAIEIPPGYYAQIRDRSSIAAAGLAVSGGVIDESYRGFLVIVMTNHTLANMAFAGGDKIAQFVVLPVPEAEIVEASELSATPRGEGGFGSTGQ